jgi:hypothetical protein
MRQGVDGSFDEAWDPDLGTEVDLEVTNVSPHEPIVYQAYYQASSIKQIFEVKGQKYDLQITKNSVDVNKNDRKSPPEPPKLTGYVSTQSLFISDTAQIAVHPLYTNLSLSKDEPTELGGKDTYIIEVDSSSLLRWDSLGSPNKTNVRIWAGNCEVHLKPNPGSGSLNGWEFKALYLQTTLTVSIDGEFYTSSVRDYSQESSGVYEIRSNGGITGYEVSLDGGTQIDLGKDRHKGSIQVKLGFQWGLYLGRTGNSAYSSFFHESSSREVNYRRTEVNTDYLFYENSGFRKQEGYLVCSGATGQDSRHIIHLVSPGLNNVPELLPIPNDITTLFSPVHQQYAEEGVDRFLKEANKLGAIANPKPKNEFDFDGPFGLYGWEIFFHIPALSASKYAENGDYDAAKRWMKCIYDPSAQGNAWGVLPLISDSNSGSRSITDPDNVALKCTLHYQHAIIRQHLEHLLAEGDDYYRQQTQETLQQAKMCYVVAKNLFGEELSQQLEVLIAIDWKNPTLAKVTAGDFRPPYNEEIKKLYQTFEKRLHNLRHWLTIDGEPLNIPLLASPIDPRQLQVAALAGVAATQAQSLSQMALPYTFDTILAKAQQYTQQLMNFANSLQVALEKRDERALEELTQIQQKNLLELVHSTQQQQINIAKKAKEALEKAKETLQTEYNGQSRFAKEYMNGPEIAATVLLPVRTASLIASSGTKTAAGFAGLIPTVFGVAFGGSKPEKPLDATADVAKALAEMTADIMDVLKDKGAYLRRQQTEQLRRDVLSKELEEIEVRLEEAALIIKLEENKRGEIQRQQDQAAQLFDFMQRRFTNQQFYEWYVSRLGNLYSAAYDATVRFALMAERAFQVETGDFTATFIRPQWDRRYKGLLAGQALWVDLQRMDLAYMSRPQPKQVLSKTISLRDLDETALKSLQTQGEAVFFLNESLFESDYPEHYGRRIQSIRVSFPALKEKGINPCGQLTQLSSRTYHSRQRDAEHSTADLFANQSIILSGCETDSRQLTMPQGRLLPFQGTGVDSTWHLSFPGAVKAVREKQIAFPQKAVLDELDDVVLEITYSAQM